MSASSFAPIATPAEALERAGLRRTRAATAALGLLLADPTRTWTHTEVENALADRGVVANRVTIYRLLERLVLAEVLEKYADHADRIWRFGLRAPESEMAQARFECDACHRHFQLPQASEPTKTAADQILNALSMLGHQGQRVDLSIHGTCAGCIEPSVPR